jgi:hypothetical protein
MGAPHGCKHTCNEKGRRKKSEKRKMAREMNRVRERKGGKERRGRTEKQTKLILAINLKNGP